MMKFDDNSLIRSISCLILSLCVCQCGARLIVTNTGQTVPGANVTITVEITDYEPQIFDYFMTWSDNAGHSETSRTAQYFMAWNVTYSKFADVELYVKVVKKVFYIPVATESATTSFKVANIIPGDLKVEQKGMDPQSKYVTTRNETNLSFVLHDPTGFFRDARFQYVWDVYPLLFDLPNEAKVSVNFTSQYSEYDVFLTVRAWVGETVFTGRYRTQVQPRDPINGLNVTGNLWLKRGEVLKLKVECKGSPQFRYCWRFRTDPVNKSEEACVNPILTNVCEFYVIWYFGRVGNYKTVIIIDNDVDHNVTVLDVNIYNVARKSQLSVIVIPVVCSVLVLAIIVFGISYYVQNRRRLRIEEANFDFQASDSVEYRTFFEQVRDEFYAAIGKPVSASSSSSNLIGSSASVRT